jgi:hypothetical protein
MADPIAYVAPANNGTTGTRDGSTAIGALNYADEYQRALEQNFPYVLNYGALYSTPNNGKYRWVNSKTIEIPSISTTGRVDADRDTIAFAQRNYQNAWVSKTLSNQRKWSTLVHPRDIDETNMVATIGNITQVFNDEHKFPEMDAYCISKIYYDWTHAKNPDTGVIHTPNTTVLTTANILAVFDSLMLAMDNGRVPGNGRILYVPFEVLYILKEAEKISRSMDITSGPNAIDRRVNRLDQVQIVGVPSTLMKTLYDFTSDYAVADDAEQINMFLVHPMAVITPVSYTFSRLDAPSAMSEGKYVYYEESFEDVFILDNKSNAIQFNVTGGGGTSTSTTTA